MTKRYISGLGLFMMVAALAALVYRHSLFGESAIPIAVQVLAAALMVWARATFGGRSFHATANPTEGGLVTSGPYRFIRHPIYSSALIFGWAGVLAHISTVNVVLGLCATIGAALRIHAEEILLVARYPEYLEYAARTQRFIPYVI